MRYALIFALAFALVGLASMANGPGMEPSDGDFQLANGPYFEPSDGGFQLANGPFFEPNGGDLRFA